MGIHNLRKLLDPDYEIPDDTTVFGPEPNKPHKNEPAEDLNAIRDKVLREKLGKASIDSTQDKN